VIIAANQDNLFRRLAEAMDKPELADDPRYASHRARAENTEELDGIIGEWTGRHDAQEIDSVLNAAGVVCGPIYTVKDIFEDPHFAARDMLLRHDDPELGPFVGPGVVPKFSATPGAVRWPGTTQEGSHNREVYGELLGLSGEEIDALEEEGSL